MAGWCGVEGGVGSCGLEQVKSSWVGCWRKEGGDGRRVRGVEKETGGRGEREWC